MDLPSNPIKPNSSLLRLTDNERNWDWLLKATVICLLLWFVSARLVSAEFLAPQFREPDEIISMFGMPLGILAIVILLVFFVFKGARLTSRETQREQLAILHGKNISQNAVFWSLVCGIFYRVRHWLTVLIGGGPYFLWLICQGYWMWAIQDNLRCLTSPLSHLYCYSDGAPAEIRQLEVRWFGSITIGILGLIVFATLCCVGFTMKRKKVVLSVAGVLALVMPIMLGFILVVAPEGYLAADTAYGSVAINEIYARMFPIGIALAVLPFVASLVTQHFLRRWAFRESNN